MDDLNHFARLRRFCSKVTDPSEPVDSGRLYVTMILLEYLLSHVATALSLRIYTPSMDSTLL